jgi:outer membrane protein OmpA-like peptidoglycan-associated protein
MMIIRKKIVIMAMLTAFCFLGPLAGNTVQAEPVQTTDNLTVQINWLEHNLSNARMDQVDILSPTQFAKAEEFLNKAKKRLERGDSQAKIIKEISRAQTELKEATESSRLAKAELSEVIKAREMARAAGATNYEQDYAATENRFLELTKAVEKDKITRARKHSPKVAERYRELELRAIKEQTLGEARTLIKQAETEGARKLAPKTYKTVQKKLKEVDGFITKNRYQKLKMHNMASEVLLQAGRLLQVTRQTKTIKTMKPEHITLWVEGILYDTATKLGTADMRDQPLGTQVENIMGSIDALQQDQRFLVNKVKNQQTEMEAMTEQIAFLEKQTQKEKAAKKQLAKEQEAIEKRLEAERRFNQLFTKVRTYFSQEEAEVYKQGSELVIRLKAIQFPVGKHVIMPSNYSLLSKAQRAIRTFGEPNLVIEGHTDSTGSDVNNQHLSQRRAESVRAYLVANGTLPMDKIIAVGYGSKRPLASNKTATGRAINRRIDVIIKTQPEAG